MKMRQYMQFIGIVIVSMGLSALLTACSDSKAANDHNLGNAIQQHLRHQGYLCLAGSAWPVVVDANDLHMQARFPRGIASQMAYLEKAGLVTGTDVTLPTQSLYGSTGRSYTVTKAGQAFYHDPSEDYLGQTQGGALCYAQKKFVALASWMPIDASADLEVIANYTYQPTDIAPWAQSPEFKTTFTDEATALATPKPERRSLILTDGQWQMKNTSSTLSGG